MERVRGRRRSDILCSARLCDEGCVSRGILKHEASDIYIRTMGSCGDGDDSSLNMSNAMKLLLSAAMTRNAMALRI